MCVPECRCPLGPEGVGSPGGGAIGDFKLPDVGAKNLGPLQEQPVLITSEPPLQSKSHF